MTTRHPHRTMTLDELTSATGVTVRTVRYYIAEGLLPPPEGAGRGARYTREHRDRLDVIAMLKARHLPLREIRQALRDLAPEEVAALAEEARGGPTDTTGAPPHTRMDAPPAMAASAPPPDSSALAYIRSLREAPAPYGQHAPPDPASVAWRRLPISPDAELLVTEEAWRRRRDQLESLITWARRIIDEP